MSKFYIQSGTLRAVLDSQDRQRAALWAVHQAMTQVTPLADDLEATPFEKSEQFCKSGLIVLDETITISEVGYDRADADRICTFDALQEWHHLVRALRIVEQV